MGTLFWLSRYLRPSVTWKSKGIKQYKCFAWLTLRFRKSNATSNFRRTLVWSWSPNKDIHLWSNLCLPGWQPQQYLLPGESAIFLFNEYISVYIIWEVGKDLRCFKAISSQTIYQILINWSYSWANNILINWRDEWILMHWCRTPTYETVSFWRSTRWYQAKVCRFHGSWFSKNKQEFYKCRNSENNDDVKTALSEIMKNSVERKGK